MTGGDQIVIDVPSQLPFIAGRTDMAAGADSRPAQQAARVVHIGQRRGFARVVTLDPLLLGMSDNPILGRAVTQFAANAIGQNADRHRRRIARHAVAGDAASVFVRLGSVGVRQMIEQLDDSLRSLFIQDGVSAIVLVDQPPAIGRLHRAVLGELERLLRRPNRVGAIPHPRRIRGQRPAVTGRRRATAHADVFQILCG